MAARVPDNEMESQASGKTVSTTAPLQLKEQEAAVFKDQLVAALKRYARMVEEEDDVEPLVASGDLTATEAAITACSLMRAANLNMFDIAMWFNRGLARRDTGGN
jgi:hypothetical protein